MKKILLLFSVFTGINFLILILANIFIPYLGFFPYKELALQDHLPFFLTKLANFDGVQYLLIIKQGYLTYNQAYFPFYPLLVRFLSFFVFGNNLLAALLVSNLSAFFGLFLFTKYCKNFTNGKNIVPILLFLLFPTSFFLNAVYTEGLFFFLFFASLFCFYKKKYAIAFLLGVLTSLTRLIGIFLVIPFGTAIFYSFRQKKVDRGAIISIFSPVVGFVLYAWYLLKTTGDPLFFYHSETVFGRSTNLITPLQVLYRYIKIFTKSAFNFQYFVSVCEFVMFIFVFFVLCYQLISLLRKKDSKEKYTILGLNLFSFANLLLPTLTGTLSSIPRYALFSFSFFIALSAISNRFVFIALCFLFFVFHILLLAFFAQGYFVG